MEPNQLVLFVYADSVDLFERIETENGAEYKRVEVQQVVRVDRQPTSAVERVAAGGPRAEFGF